MSDPLLFAVVGHPNKGKSSVVAALTQNDEVPISPVSGTTRVAQRFTLRLDEKVLFELVDTPGFQRPHPCLEWLNQAPVTADQKPARVAAFVAEHAGTDRFRDEVELLRPIVEGAGIIYVVDGSLPYSPEYENEMEILRWTGRPRLALINPIGGQQHVLEWEQALGQYFSLVRVFDPMHATFEQHLELLRTFGQLTPARRAEFEEATRELETYRAEKLRQAARIIVESLYRLLSWQVSRPAILNDSGTLSQVLPDEIERFNTQLNKIEREGRRGLEVLFGHRHLNAAINRLELAHGELMDREQWSLWGLNRRQLVIASAGAGAAIGFVADVGLGGHSLMAGTLGGGLVGGVSGWLGTNALKDKLPAWLQVSARKKVLGPVKDPNFCFVILARSLAHAHAMLSRSHANRDDLAIGQEDSNLMQSLDPKTQVRLLKLSRQLRRQGLHGEAAGELEAWVLGQLTA